MSPSHQKVAVEFVFVAAQSPKSTKSVRKTARALLNRLVSKTFGSRGCAGFSPDNSLAAPLYSSIAVAQL
jgi:hypothetical protein